MKARRGRVFNPVHPTRFELAYRVGHDARENTGSGRPAMPVLWRH